MTLFLTRPRISVSSVVCWARTSTVDRLTSRRGAIRTAFSARLHVTKLVMRFLLTGVPTITLIMSSVSKKSRIKMAVSIKRLGQQTSTLHVVVSVTLRFDIAVPQDWHSYSTTKKLITGRRNIKKYIRISNMSYPCNGNPHTWKDGLYIDMRPRLPTSDLSLT